MATVSDLHAKRAKLVEEKSKVTKAIMDINHYLLATIPRSEYIKATDKKHLLVRSIQDLEAQIAKLNSELLSASQAEVLASKSEKAATNDKDVTIVRQIIEMRDHYQAFAADATRSPTMRRMASEFSLKLTPVIKQAMRKGVNPE